MYPDKFIDSFIEDVYSLENQGSNVFFIRGNKQDDSYLNTNKPVVYIGRDDNLYTLLSKINKHDIIWVHWYDYEIGEILMNFSNKIIVSAWGGEFLTIPEFKSIDFLYDKYSKTYMNNLLFRKKMNFNLFRAIKNKRNQSKIVKRRDEQISKIDYIVISEPNDFEFNLYKKFNPTLKARMLYGFYNSNFDFTKDIHINKIDTDTNILLGNSSDPSNNHFESINLISKIQAKIYCPLSYGDEKYANEIINHGINILGDNFIPIKKIMPRKQYMHFLAKIDIVIFYHNRSQAFGNIIALLCLGKVLFLKPKNTLYHLIKSIGLNCYDANKINEYNLKELILIEKSNREKNLLILEKLYSNENRLKDLTNIFNLLDSKIK